MKGATPRFRSGTLEAPHGESHSTNRESCTVGFDMYVNTVELVYICIIYMCKLMMVKGSLEV